MTLANALQDRINFKLREKKHASVTRHLQRHMYLRTNMHWRNSTQPKGLFPRAFRCQLQSEPAKHIMKHPNHKFSWDVLTTAHMLDE